MYGLAHPWSTEPKASLVTRDPDEVVEWLADRLFRGAAMLERNGLGQFQCWNVARGNWERVMLGKKASRTGDTFDTISQDAYEARPSVSFADFVGA